MEVHIKQIKLHDLCFILWLFGHHLIILQGIIGLSVWLEFERYINTPNFLLFYYFPPVNKMIFFFPFCTYGLSWEFFNFFSSTLIFHEVDDFPFSRIILISWILEPSSGILMADKAKWHYLWKFLHVFFSFFFFLQSCMIPKPTTKIRIIRRWLPGYIFLDKYDFSSWFRRNLSLPWYC